MLEGASGSNDNVGFDGDLDLLDGTAELLPDIVDGLLGEVLRWWAAQQFLVHGGDERSSAAAVADGSAGGSLGRHWRHPRLAVAVREDSEPRGQDGVGGVAAAVHDGPHGFLVNRSVHHQ